MPRLGASLLYMYNSKGARGGLVGPEISLGINVGQFTVSGASHDLQHKGLAGIRDLRRELGIVADCVGADGLRLEAGCAGLRIMYGYISAALYMYNFEQSSWDTPSTRYVKAANETVNPQQPKGGWEEVVSPIPKAPDIAAKVVKCRRV